MPTVVSKKSVWMFVAALVSSVYAAFVSMCMWNWFATRALHVPEVSFLEMLGLMWLIRLLTFSGDGDQYQWAMLWTVLEEVVPSDKRGAVHHSDQSLGTDRDSRNMACSNKGDCRLTHIDSLLSPTILRPISERLSDRFVDT